MTLEEEAFIDAVQNLSVIWDPKNADHKNKIVIENAWKTVATIAGVTGNFFIQILAIMKPQNK